MLLYLFLLLPISAVAEDVRLTVYDDGISCPGDCDAHVVFHSTLNGTEFAHSPKSAAAPYAKCTTGSECTICFASGNGQCMKVMYRGSGPTPSTFDLTPKFYEENCPSSSKYAFLRDKCSELRKAAANLIGWTNCIRNPDDENCKIMIIEAQERQSTDRKLYEQCRAEGESKYNAGRPNADRRSEGCAYEFKGTGGPNSKGNTWRKLLPGVCRAGTFVGRDGLDCCNGNPSSDGPLGIECKIFYLKP